jgi:DNA modification methylase
LEAKRTDSASSDPSKPWRQTTLRHLVTEAVREAPRRLAEVYAIVTRLRPGTARETIRARIYEQVGAGRILRVAEGVYFAVDGPAAMLLLHGDTWDLLPQFPEGVLSAIVTDQAYDLGTKENSEAGTTRPHGREGRTYEVRDLDEAFFRAAFRALRKDHEWNSLASGKTIPGGGACLVFSPARTAQTAPHIDAMHKLAEQCGFVFQAELVWDFEDRAMGYWPPQEHQLIHIFTAGPRAGVPHDLSMTSIIRERRIRRNWVAEDEHEAEKPVGLFLKLLRFVSRPGDLVLDCFAGRARWAREAVARGWNVVLIERDETWVQRVRDDWLHVQV